MTKKPSQVTRSHLLQFVACNYPLAVCDAFVNLAVNPWARPRSFMRYLLDHGKQRSEAMADDNIPTVDISDLFPCDNSTFLQLPPQLASDRSEISSAAELATLGAAIQSRNPRRVFEFGTFRGTTTLFMAANLPDAAGGIVTLDLPQDQVKHQVGEAFREHPLQARIRQLHGDSINMDLSEFSGTCDLVFIDGNHTRDGVFSDTKKAGQMLGPRGVILWHDFRLGVYPRPIVEAVKRSRELCGRTGRIAHVRGTSIAAFLADD